MDGARKTRYPSRPFSAPVAQRIRVLASEAKGRGFESRRARQITPIGATHMKRLLSGILFLLSATAALAQQYPSRSVTLMVPFAPGPTDTVARIVAQAMQKPFGETIVIENRP